MVKNTRRFWFLQRKISPESLFALNKANLENSNKKK